MPPPLLTLRPLDAARCAWAMEQDGRLTHGASSWEALPRPAPGARIRLLLPGDQVTHASTVIAARNPRMIAKALPYALEEQLAEDVEQLRIAHGPSDAGGRVAARVTRGDRLDALLVRLKALSLAPDAVYSELDALPAPAEGWAVLRLAPPTGEGDETGLILARSADDQTLALEPSLLDAVLGDAPRRAIHAPDGPWVWLHRHLDERGAINLIDARGEYGALAGQLRPWRVPAVLAACALLLQVGLMMAETVRLNHERAIMQADIERLARDAAPEVRRWINPLAQLRQMTSGAATSTPSVSGLLPLLAQAAPLLAAQPAINLGQLRYQGRTLDAQLSAPQGAALDALLASLRKQPGLSAELAEQRVEGAQAQARLRLKGARG